MASEHRRGWRQYLVWLSGAVTALIIFALLLALWLIGTESGARAAFTVLQQWSGNAIVVQSVQGRLIGPLAIGELRLEKDGTIVQASQLSLHWQPGRVREGLVHLSLLQADQVKLSLAEQDDTKPPPFPALPFRLQLDQLEIDALTFGHVNNADSWQSQPLRLRASATLDNARLVVSDARIERNKGSANLAGTFDLSGAQSFSAQGEFQHLRLHDFGHFPDWPDTILSGRFDAQGQQQPQAHLQMQFTLTDSRIDRQHLSAEGQFSFDAEQLNIPRLRIVAGANTLSLQGRLLAKESTMQGVRFTLQAPRLSELGAGFSGALQVSGTANGTLFAPTLALQGQASQLRLPGDLAIGSAKGDARFILAPREPLMFKQVTATIRATHLARRADRIAALQIQWQASPDAEAPLHIMAEADNIALAGHHINTLMLTVDGSAQQHDITAKIDGRIRNLPHDMPLNLRFTAEGSLADLTTQPQWQGLLTSATLGGKYPVQLNGNTRVVLSAQRLHISAMALSTPYGQVRLDDFSRDDAALTGRGSFSGVQLASLLPFFGAHPVASTDLLLGGDWDLRLTDTLEARIALRRTAGDVRVRSETPLALGLQKFEASAVVRDGRLSLRLAAEGSQLGVVSLNGSSTVRAGNTAFLPDAQSPLQAELTMALPSIVWVGPVVSPLLITAGSVRGNVAVSGTLADPQFRGQIGGQKLRVHFVGSGIDLQQGVLESDFADDTLHIRQLRFSSGDGEIAATGPVTFKAGKIAAMLQVRAARFTVLDRVDRKLTLSGTAMLALTDGRARLDGKLSVDAGLIDLGRAGEPQLSDDVIIVGRKAQQGKALAADIDVTIDFGENMVLRGQGLHGHIGGDLRVTSSAGSPLQARGSLKIVRGTYKAYGRELVIERGNVRFDGAPGNPALDIRAMRRGLEVEAGVAIGGSALAPRVTLVSEPTVPDAEKLSWLVLGQGLTAAGSTDMGALQSAAASLLSQGAAASMQSQLASAFGVDTITLSQRRDNLQQRIITVGKRVSSRLTISYQQGLQSAGNAVIFRYTLSPRLSIEAETGTRSVFSLFYNFAFD